MHIQIMAAPTSMIRPAPHMGDGEDLSQTMAAELTGTLGYNDGDLIGEGSMLPDDLADDLEQYDDQRARDDAHLFMDETQRNQLAALQGLSTHELSTPPNQPVPPSDALQQERARLAEQSNALEQQRQNLAAIQQQNLAVQQANLEAHRWAQLEAQVPDFEIDPEGHVAAKFRLQELRVQEAAQADHHRREFSAQTQQVQQEAQQIGQVMASVEQEFVDSRLNGDSAAYQSAFDHVNSRVAADMRQRYPGLDDAGMQTLQMIASVQFIKNCAQMGINPAEHIFGKAKELGWRSANARVPHQNAPRQNHSLTQLANMSDKQFDKAMAPPGQSRSKGVTLEALGQMDDAEFDKFFDSMRGSNQLGFGG
ncbi:hypothetical protein [Pseudomonas fluorescens]|uniref:Uncharacterized protein n=1 Tax=Pseudomonas fluorescens TaxID=294 RepID=A0A0F4T1B2_PSEFL|nr:hypothetical protein [Pseudomonas fluorescens]KJZ37197.1 hypothetical protein VC34_26240 [Pseudomonas fluorescens]